VALARFLLLRTRWKMAELRALALFALVVGLAAACSPANGDPAGVGFGPTGEAGAPGDPGVGGSDGFATGGEAGTTPVQNTGGAETGGAPSGSGGAAPWCGDGNCDWPTETCDTCPSDCTSCATGGTGGGPAATGGTGGSGAGGGSGGLDALHQAAQDRAKAGVGFSYWWGHGAYRPEGPSGSNAGSCSGSCPTCSHSGTYGGDCSGFAAKVWQVPSSNTDMTADSHPYSTADFNVDGSQWSTVSLGTMQAMDAMVYRSGGAGHIFVYDHGDQWGSMYAYECKGCSYGCTGGLRTASSAYHSIRRTGY
jgi:hypothetical protein